MGEKFLLKKDKIGNWWRVNYVMHTNNKHEYTPILFLPTKRKWKDNDDDFWTLPISVIGVTLEAAEKMLLDRLNDLDQNLFTWK